jgi:hypothetical protein
MNAKNPLASETTSAPTSVDLSGDRRVLDRLSALTDRDFEQRLVVGFEALGYTVDGETGFQSINLMMQVADQVWLVRSREWRNPSIDEEPVGELIAEVNRNEATGGIVVCAGTFTEAARRRARGSGVRLLNGAELAGMLLKTTAGVAKQSCPRCGSELIDRPTKAEREVARRQFRGCSEYPACHYTQGAAA